MMFAIESFTDSVAGIDAGITSLITLSTGEKITNPRHERADRARLARAQRALSGDLIVRNMAKNHSLARAISDASWRQLRTGAGTAEAGTAEAGTAPGPTMAIAPTAAAAMRAVRPGNRVVTVWSGCFRG